MLNNKFSSLIAKKLIGEITEEESRELEDLIKTNEELKHQYLLINGFLDDNANSEDDVQKAFNTVLNKIKWQEGSSATEENKEKEVSVINERRNKFFRRTYLIKAAVLLIVLCGLAYIGLVIKRNVEDRGIIEANKNWKIIENTGEQKKEVILEDGTKVYLRKRSVIKYNEHFGKKSREILLEGEAFFDVAKNSEVPLIIHAGNIDVRVTGTAFNISAYPGESYVSTSLVRGSVEVTNRSDPGRVIQLKPNEKLIVKADAGNEQTSAGIVQNGGSKEELNGQPYIIKALETEPSSLLIPELSWIDAKLVFNRETFGEIANKMEHWYNVRVHFEDNDIYQQVFTGVFEKESLRQALDALKLSYPFDYTIENGTDVFIRKSNTH